MANRTNANAVRAVIECDPAITLDQFIETANALTDYVASQDTDGILSTKMLKQIETYLAAHYYSLRDPQYKSKTVGDASGVYQDRNWWDEAKRLDLTGTLAAMEEGVQEAKIIWLGQSVAEEADYWDRN